MLWGIRLCLYFPVDVYPVLLCLTFVKLFFSFTISFITSVCPSVWNNSAPTGRIFVKFCIECLFENLSRKFKYRTRISGTVHENQYTFYIISPSILLRMRKVSARIYKENQHTNFVSNFSENRAVSEIMRKNIAEPGKAQMTIRRIRIECWSPKATNIH